MRKLPAALALATLCLTLTSCGQTEEAKASLSRSFQKEDLGQTDVSREQADCMADGIVDGVGVDQLKEYEVLDDDATVNDNLGETELSEEDAETVAAALVDCIGAEEIVEAQMLQDQMTEQQRSCVLDAIDAEQLTTLIAAGFRGGEPDADTQAQMQEDVNACMKKK
jgi:hypothetical protein